MKESPNETDPNINAQLIKKFFFNLEYVFHLDSTNKKLYHIIDTTLAKNKAYELFFSEFDHFSPTFSFLTPKERNIHCSHVPMFTC